jgi:phosphotransferase system enzyme I (PtsI)
VDTEGVDVLQKFNIPDDLLNKEVNRFKTAVNQSRRELRAIINASKKEFNGHSSILEAHELLLRDKMLYARTIETIQKEQVNAEWALKKVVATVKRVFMEMEDHYLKERAEDVVQVSDQILRHLAGANSVNIAEINKRVILVAPDLSPAETSQINLERIKGFVTDVGARASHTGIIARALQLPAVLGASAATRRIQNDDLIIVDGIDGSVVIHPEEETIIAYEEKGYNYETFRAGLLRQSSCEATTQDGIEIPVMGNIELFSEVVSAKDHGADGVGLYRTEFQFVGQNRFPTEEEMYADYRDVVEVMAPKSVTIRTLDVNGDKALTKNQRTVEPNPALGLRGIRYCLARQGLFISQLKAILRAAAHGKVRILLPMISVPSEIDQTIQLLDRAARELAASGQNFHRDIELGVMIEVPAAAMVAELFAPKVDFFSIGTNDLIQYTLAIDRGNSEVEHLFQPLHPAVLQMIRHVIQVGKDNKVKVYMFGEMDGELEYLPILLVMGLDELSMNPQAIPAVKCMIRGLTLEESRAFAGEIFTCNSVEAAHALIQSRYGKLMREMTMPDPTRG